MIGLTKVPFSSQYFVDFVSEYGFVRWKQMERLMVSMGIPFKKTRAQLASLRNYSPKVFFDKETDGFYSFQYEEPSQAQFRAMDKCLWVLIDFLKTIDHHFPVASSFSPSQICMMLENRSYEIAYCPAGNEAYFSNQLRAARMELLYRADATYFSPIVEKDDKAMLEATKYIIIVEDIEAAKQIQSSLIAHFVTLDEWNACTFYTPDEIYGMA